jgi:hypothetical protein
MGSGQGVLQGISSPTCAPTQYRHNTDVLPTLVWLGFDWGFQASLALLTQVATPHIRPLSRSVGKPAISEIMSEVVKIRLNARSIL